MMADQRKRENVVETVVLVSHVGEDSDQNDDEESKSEGEGAQRVEDGLYHQTLNSSVEELENKKVAEVNLEMIKEYKELAKLVEEDVSGNLGDQETCISDFPMGHHVVRIFGRVMNRSKATKFIAWRDWNAQQHKRRLKIQTQYLSNCDSATLSPPGVQPLM